MVQQANDNGTQNQKKEEEVPPHRPAKNHVKPPWPAKRLIAAAFILVTVFAYQLGKKSESNPLPDHKPTVAVPKPGAVLVDDTDKTDLSTLDEARAIPGLGELRASRPGERQEQERPLTLVSHKVKVRISGIMARTEIEEMFRNDSSDTLQGIYRFPLPAGAQIAGLWLLVDGKWQQGVFVDRGQAKKIWAGVIRNATPEQQRRPHEEYIWVPGPWKDPALLEWQRGGRFELRIFPIAGRGERIIRLAYTEVIAPYGQARRYLYPLPLANTVSASVGRFELDAKITGVRQDAIQVAGYQTRAVDQGNATELQYAENGFRPEGDLIIDYRLPHDQSELRFWTYRGTAGWWSADGTPESEAVGDTAQQRALQADQRAYVAFALRPQYAVGQERLKRDYVLIVDASQSMVGARYRQALALATRMVSEMDSGDRVTVLACDATCQEISPPLLSASAQTAARVQRFLQAIEPAGASDLVSAMRAAMQALAGQMETNRAVRLVYIGDGNASVGYRAAASIAAETEAITVGDPRVTLTAVGIGSDADSRVLSAWARAGGGHYIPYMPGQTTRSAARVVLESTQGATLKNPELILPEGVVETAPRPLPNIGAGEEIVVVGRLTKERVKGEVELRATIAGQPFSRKYPVEFAVVSDEGNAFVPRLWAAVTIEQMELSGRGEDQARIIALSKKYRVMSRYTSLLVLESEAMLRAYHLDDKPAGPQWSGEEEMEGGESQAESEVLQVAGGGADKKDNAIGEGAYQVGPSGGPQGSVQRAAPAAPASVAARGERGEQAESAAPRKAADDSLALAEDRSVERARKKEASAQERESPSKIPADWMPGQGRWMKKVWVREAQIQASAAPRSGELRAVQEALSALGAKPDSRDRHRDLVRALCRAGELAQAGQYVRGWIERDRLDPEALIYLSDIVGRQGGRDRALRILSGVVDIRTEDRLLQERLAAAFERAGMPERACAHRIALAEERSEDPEALGAAIRCERDLGRATAASRLLDRAPNESVRRLADTAASKKPAKGEPARGELTLDAHWSPAVDLDLTLVTPQGTRLSWMGGRVSVIGGYVNQIGREQLGLRKVSAGSYLVEISRSRPADGAPVRGQVHIEVLKQRKTLPFNLTESRATIGRLVVSQKQQIVPL